VIDLACCIQQKTLGQQRIPAALLSRSEGTEEMKGWNPKYIPEGISLEES